MSYSWYRKGTCAATNGSDTVRFQNADITTSANKPVIGDAFTLDQSELYEVIFIGSDAGGEFVRLNRVFAQATVQNAKYALVRLASSTINAKIAAIAAAAINQKQISLDDMYEWYTSTADTVDFLGPDGVPVTITTYHYLSNAIGSVGGNIADVEAVARELAAVKTVSSNIADVSAVGADIDAVKAVNAEIADVKTVAANVQDVKDVGSNIVEVKAVGADMPAITTVNSNIDDIKAVNANMPAINNVNTQVVHIDQQVAHVDTQKGIVDQQTIIATTKASESEQSASESLASKDAAKISETNSKDSEVKSKISETNSKISETNSKASEDAAAQSKAATAADAIATAADRVATGQDVISAKASEVKAEDWANKTDGPVDGVKYSSEYWANIAKMNADLTFLSGGVFKPTVSQEYPVPDNPSRDTLFLIGFDKATDSYTFTSGDLNGTTIFNTDQLLWDVPSNVFVHVPSPTGAAILSVNNKTGSTITLRSEDIPHELGTVFTALKGKVNKTDIATLVAAGITQLSNSYVGVLETKAVTEKALSEGLAHVSKAENVSTKSGSNVQAELDARKAIRVSMLDNPLVWLFKKNTLVESLKGALSYSRATTATYVDRYGVLRTAEVDEPRPEAAGWLLEGASTNQFIHSTRPLDWSYNTNFFDMVEYNLNGLTIGEVSAHQTPTSYPSITGYKGILSVVDGDKVTASAVVKKLPNAKLRFRFSSADGGAFRGDCVVYLDGITSNKSIQVKEMADGFFRVSHTFTASHTESLRLNFAAEFSTDDTLYVGCFQFESLPFASSYIPTDDTPVTRAADKASFTFYGNGVLSDRTITANVSLLGPYGLGANARRHVYSSAGSLASNYSNGYLYERSDGSLTAMSAIEGSSGSDVVSAIPSVDGKYAWRKQGDKLGLLKDGELLTEATRTTPAMFNTLHVGSQYGTQRYLYGHLSDFRIYDFALTADEVAYLQGAK